MISTPPMVFAAASSLRSPSRNTSAPCGSVSRSLASPFLASIPLPASRSEA